MIDDDEVRQALRRQWRRIAEACEHLDDDLSSRVNGWRNAEVLAHLAIQPVLLARFLSDACPHQADMRLADNLAGTHTLAQAIDTAARDGARAGRVAFARHAAEVDQALVGADLAATVTTMQGRIRLADYLRTRCIEAVVHGQELQPAVEPDPVARTVAAQGLLTLLHDRPDALAAARELTETQLIDIATGRSPAAGDLAHIMPLMT